MKSPAPDIGFFLRHFTRKRRRNAWAMLNNYYASRRSRKPEISALPLALSIEPTTACNLGCPECPSGLKSFTRPTGTLKPEVLENLLDEIGDTLFYLTFYFQGEPFIHPGMTELIAKASGRGIYTATSTNAHFITDAKAEEIVRSGLNRLIISIDGTSQEVYEQYRRKGNLDKVIKGTEAILTAKKRLNAKFPRVYFQFLVVRPNEHQIADVKALGKRLGVDKVLLKTAQVYDYKHGNDLIPTIDKYARYRQTADGTWEIKNKLLDHCWKMWHSCVITWDGRVVPCCFDKDAQHQMGQIGDKSFHDVWFGRRYKAFRGAVMRSRKDIDICKNCSAGTKVWS